MKNESPQQMPKMKSYLFILVVLILSTYSAYSQWGQQEQITTFSSIIDSPIKIEVQERDGQYAFFAQNRSLYPYELTIEFADIRNLQPASVKKKIVLYPGKNHLLTLKQKDEDIEPYYSYAISYAIGDPKSIPDKDFPYLIPIGIDKTTKLYTSDNKYMIDHFALQEGDTIYCMRKGFVTATPNMFHSSDKIAKSNSVEIRHNDGSIMIYQNLKDDVVFTNLSEKVYPGQALGVINEKEHLIVQLYKLAGGQHLKRMEIKYAYNDKKAPFSQDLTKIKTEYPLELIFQEMSKREIKRYKKKNQLK